MRGVFLNQIDASYMICIRSFVVLCPDYSSLSSPLPFRCDKISRKGRVCQSFELWFKKKVVSVVIKSWQFEGMSRCSEFLRIRRKNPMKWVLSRSLGLPWHYFTMFWDLRILRRILTRWAYHAKKSAWYTLFNSSSPSMVQRTMTRFSWKSPERGTTPLRGTHFALRFSQYWKRVLSHFLWYWFFCFLSFFGLLRRLGIGGWFCENLWYRKRDGRGWTGQRACNYF